MNIQVVKHNSTLLVTLNNLHVVNNVGKVELISVANRDPDNQIDMCALK